MQQQTCLVIHLRAFFLCFLAGLAGRGDVACSAQLQ